MQLYTWVNQLMLAFVILLIGCIIGKIVEKTVGSVLHGIEVNALLKKLAGTKILLEEALSKVTKWLVYIMTWIIALKQLGIETIVLNILFWSIILFCLIGALLGLRDFIPNALGGLLMYKKGILKKGEVIRVTDVEGRIKSITLVQTILETKNGDMIYIPNATLVKELFWKKKK